MLDFSLAPMLHLASAQKKSTQMAFYCIYCLLRLMLQAPELIIFDEATSALDNTNEAEIQQNIERIFNKKTVITIAHRLTTLKNADRILVFDAGKISQEGDFKTLSETKGLFQDFLQQRNKPLILKEPGNG